MGVGPASFREEAHQIFVFVVRAGVRLDPFAPVGTRDAQGVAEPLTVLTDGAISRFPDQPQLMRTGKVEELTSENLRIRRGIDLRVVDPVAVSYTHLTLPTIYSV